MPKRPVRPRAEHTQRELWRCPKCGAAFVTRHMSHSCGRFSLEQHFRDKPKAIREAFDRLRALIEACGPVEMIPQKTRIVFMTRMRFAAAVPRTLWLDGHLVLARHVHDPRFGKVVRYGPSSYTHAFRAHDRSFFDAPFAEYVRESYIRGRQEHERT